MSDGLAPLPYALPQEGGGFRSDMRFAAAPEIPPPATEDEAEDPIATAFAKGFEAGVDEALAAAAQQAQTEAEAREALALNIARLNDQLAEELQMRLRDTVAALCEAALAPLALDEAALLRRIERAAAMFARVDDERVIRLNPDDLTLIAPGLAGDWHIEPDALLPRGALRVECANGGVEDGPEQWRRAIAEALHQC